jgi:hypothetical protein
MTSTIPQRNIALLIEELEIPVSAYARVERRYQSLGEFFSSDRARSSEFSPHIYSQGSFRLGTVIRPLDNGDYDIDVGCRLRNGISKVSHTQEQLKWLVGNDLETYRLEHRIEEALEEKHRCWRLDYQDELAFHMDVVPSIPEDFASRQVLLERMRSGGIDLNVAAQVAQHAGAITDNRSSDYRQISPNWKISNSEGFALWFESRMRQAQLLLERHAAQAGTTIDRLPSRRWNSPLQGAIRILKRHRDIMYRDSPDAKPISVIITTLAAQAYRGEADLESTLGAVLQRMEDHVRPAAPRVPNPVNPVEDFADKWADPAYAHLQLERNFRAWLAQAQADFANLRTASTVPLLERALTRYGVSPGQRRLMEAVGAGGTARVPPGRDRSARRVRRCGT